VKLRIVDVTSSAIGVFSGGETYISCDIVENAQHNGPQIVTKHGKDVVVVLSQYCDRQPGKVKNMDIQYSQSAIFTPSDFAFIVYFFSPCEDRVLLHNLDIYHG
jgi:hypothetical protein